MLFQYLAGPLIGAIIGYCTNYIAVKMLFFPKKEIHLFGHRLPFTPGAIPKGQPRLAKAIGEIVGTTLLTKEDIESKLLSEDVLSPVTDGIAAKMADPIKDTIFQTVDFTEEQYENGKEKLALMISGEMADALSKMELSEIIAEKGGAVVKQIVKGTMLEMFLSEELIRSVTVPIGAELQQMLSTQGAEYIKPYVLEKLGQLETKSSLDLLTQTDITEADIRKTLSSVFEKMLIPSIGKIVDTIDISGIVAAKVREMSIDELENLVLTVMKKELNMIVNLGALIGFLLGLLNLIF